MLSTEHMIRMKGITLFRDHFDKRKYYYLPKSDVRIAGNGKKISYYAYVNSEMRDSSEPKFNNDIDQTGGYLTLEVELGPTDEELDNLKKEFASLLPYAQKQALAEKKEHGESIDEKELDDEDNISSADEFVLAPVMFKKGDVKLLILGEDGSPDNPNKQIKIAGSQYPSLFGQQKAVFSVRLGGKDAELMFNLLTNKNEALDKQELSDAENRKVESHINSQIAVLYNLTFKGIEPAHYVKITVDFAAIEKYWHHHFELDGNFNYGINLDGTSNVAIAADVDVDVMFRDLLNEGCIIVQQIDYSGNNSGSPLPANDPMAMNFVKKLLTAELFEPTIIPKDDYSAFSEAVKKMESVAGDDATGKDDGEKSTGGNPLGQTPDQGAPSEHEGTPVQPMQNAGNSEFPSFKSMAGDINLITKEVWKEKGLSEEDFDEYAIILVPLNDFNLFLDKHKDNRDILTIKEKLGKKTFITKEDWKTFEAPDDLWDKLLADVKDRKKQLADVKEEKFITEEQYNKFKDDHSKKKTPDEAEQTGSDSSTAPIGGKESHEETTEEITEESINSEVSALDWNLDVRLAYTYKKRDLKEVKKRTYIFNKSQAVDYKIHPSGMLTVDGTEFDSTKQVALGRLGQGIFREHTIQFYSVLDFDTYHLKYIGIDVSHPDSTGKVLNLTKESPRGEISFYSDSFGIKGKPGEKLKYKVSMVFDSKYQVGFDNNESICIEKEYETSEKVITIGEGNIETILPLSIVAGTLTLDQNIKSASLSLLEDDGTESLGPSVYVQNLESKDSQIVLLNSAKDYRARIQYNLESPFHEVPLTKRELTVTTDVLKAKELDVKNPNSGMVLFRTADGDDTFISVRSIEVVLKQGENIVSFILSKSVPKYYFVTDYNAGSPEKITIESAVAYLRDGSVQNIPLSIKEFNTDRTEYVLNF